MRLGLSQPHQVEPTALAEDAAIHVQRTHQLTFVSKPVVRMIKPALARWVEPTALAEGSDEKSAQ